MTPPAVSVILPVYNGAADVPFAVRSILEQSFGDFELIAINDGSPRDNSLEVLQHLKETTGDPRMIVVDMPQNVGLAAALNHGIGLARGRYIARQDQDDLSFPTRLAQQVAFLDQHPTHALVGTRAEIWIGDEKTERFHDHATDNATLQFDLLFNNPFVHSSVMIRKDALADVGGYSTDRARQPPEDYELWSRIARKYEVANLADRLLAYREVPQSMSRVSSNPFLEKLLMLSAENIALANGLAEPDGRCRDAASLIHVAYDRVSEQARIEPLLALLAGARGTFAARFPGQDFRAAEGAYRDHLIHHFAMARGMPKALQNSAWARRLPLPQTIKTAFKRLFIR